MLDRGLAEILVCPRDKLPLTEEPGSMSCPKGHRYAVVEGIPILLLGETLQTHIEGSRSLVVAELGEAARLPQFDVVPGRIDPFVQNAIAATNGSLYQHLVGKLTEYPIPKLKLPSGDGKLFLEIGCSWGRWCIAASRIGYRAVGVDPSLKGVRAARRVARQLGVDARYVVADGRYLPFRDGLFDQVFSYSVLQHLPKQDVYLALRAIQDVLRPGGHREARDFEVRYWTPRELVSAFHSAIGPAHISVDGYFSLNAQISDVLFLPPKYRAIVRASESLRKISEVFPLLAYVADSLYITASRQQ